MRPLTNHSTNLDPFQKVIAQLLPQITAAKAVIVKRMGALGLQFIQENFQKQGFQGAALEPWAKREDPKDQGRPILIGKQSGLLSRSPFVSYSDAEKVIITSSLPYSRIHNEGGVIHHPAREGHLHFDSMPDKGLWRIGKTRTVKQIDKIVGSIPVSFGEHDQKMKKRQFMGASPVLDARIVELIKVEGIKAFQVKRT